MNTASLILIVFAFFVLLFGVGTLIALVLWRRESPDSGKPNQRDGQRV